MCPETRRNNLIKAQIQTQVCTHFSIQNCIKNQFSSQSCIQANSKFFKINSNHIKNSNRKPFIRNTFLNSQPCTSISMDDSFFNTNLIRNMFSCINSNLYSCRITMSGHQMVNKLNQCSSINNLNRSMDCQKSNTMSGLRTSINSFNASCYITMSGHQMPCLPNSNNN